MRVREIFATHLQLTDRPLRVQCKEGLSRIRVDAEQGEVIVRLLGAIFFPKDTKTDDLIELLGGDRYECGIVLEVGEQALRIRRGVQPDSIRLQLMDPSGRFQTRYEGEEAVAEAIATYFRLSEPLLFRVFNLGEFGALSELDADIAPEAGDDDGEWDDLGWEEATELRVGVLGSGSFLAANKQRFGADAGEIARLQSEYRFAVEAEALEARCADLAAEIERVDASLHALSPAASENEEILALREALEDHPQGVTARRADWQILTHPEEQLKERTRHVNVLNQRLERITNAPVAAKPVWKNPVFVVGGVLTVVCTAIAVLGGDRLRGAAFGNVLFLGFSLFGLLAYFRDKDGVDQRSRHLETVTRERAEAQEELERYQVALAEVRSRLHVESAQELRDIEQKMSRLRTAEKEVAEARRQAQDNPEYVALAAQRHRHQESLDELRLRRESLGGLVSSAEEIAVALASMGAPLEEKQPNRTPTGNIGTVLGADVLNQFDPFPAMALVAQHLGLMTDEGIEEETLDVWAQILGPMWDGPIEPELTRAGEFFLEENDDLGAWLRLNDWQRWLTVETLVIAMTLRLYQLGTDAGPMPLLFRFQPFSSLPPTKSPGLAQLYRTLGRHVQVIAFDKALGR